MYTLIFYCQTVIFSHIYTTIPTFYWGNYFNNPIFNNYMDYMEYNMDLDKKNFVKQF